jgi:hypothetical protein
MCNFLHGIRVQTLLVEEDGKLVAAKALFGADISNDATLALQSTRMWGCFGAARQCPLCDVTEASCGTVTVLSRVIILSCRESVAPSAMADIQNRAGALVVHGSFPCPAPVGHIPGPRAHHRRTSPEEDAQHIRPGQDANKLPSLNDGEGTDLLPPMRHTASVAGRSGATVTAKRVITSQTVSVASRWWLSQPGSWSVFCVMASLLKRCSKDKGMHGWRCGLAVLFAWKKRFRSVYVILGR